MLLLTPTKPLPKSLHRTQKGRWRHHPQGVSRPIKSKTVLNKHKARTANFWSTYCQPTKWFEVDEWDSEFDWKPLLDCDYSEVFDQSCKKHSHYFDAVRGDLEGGTNEEFASLSSDQINHHCTYCFTALEEDLFSPKGFYVGSGSKPIVFDSGCSIAH